jgi:hypothetical protein
VSEPRNDQPLDEFLERRSRLAQAYRDSAREEPAAALDEAVLAASRRAIHSRPRRVGWVRRWGAPLAAAAVLTLAIAVVLRVEQEHPSQRSSTELDDLRQPPIQPKTSQIEEQAKTARIEESAKRDDAPARSDSDRTQPATAAPRTLSESKDESRLARKAPAEMRDRSAPQSLRKEAAKPQTQTQQPSVATKSEAAQSQERFEAEAGAGSRKKADRATPAPASAPPAEADARGLAKQSAANERQEEATVPQQQIDAVKALYREGRTREADQALRDFCQRFPADPLPEELLKQAARLELACARRQPH